MKNKGSKERLSVMYSIKNLDSGKCVVEMFFGLPPQGIRSSKI